MPSKTNKLPLARALVIYNPRAGSVVEADLWLGTIVDYLCTRLNYLVSVFATHREFSEADVVSCLREPTDLIVAAGGDGTIRLVLAAVSKSKLETPVAIIPFGTGNQLARNLGIYSDNFFVDPLNSALDAISTGFTRKIDLGVMNGHYFCVGVGAGPISDAVLSPSAEDKASWRMLAYVGSMLQTIAAQPLLFRVSADGDTFQIKAMGVFVVNVGNFGIATISDTASLDDGLLDLCIVTLSEFNDYLKLGFQLATAFLGGDGPYYVRKVKKVAVEVLTDGNESPAGSQTYPANVDGDSCGTLPMKIEVVPSTVNIIAAAPDAIL